MYRRTLLGGLTATLALGARPAASQTRPEILAAATLRSLSLTRRDWRAEREADERRLRERPEKEEATIVVSNSCGEAEATFRIIRATAGAPTELVDQRRIDEWCRPPIPFEEDMWLLVLDPDTHTIVDRLVTRLTHAGTLIALRSSHAVGTLSAETEAQLALSPLTDPVPVPLPGRLNEEDMRVYAAQRPGFEVRDGGVVIARAILLDRIFPGLRFDDFF